MSKSASSLMPNSVKMAAAHLAKADGVSLNQFIAVAVAWKVGSIESADTFLTQRAGEAKPSHLPRLLRAAPKVKPASEDARRSYWLTWHQSIGS